MTGQTSGSAIGAWCWRLLPLALLLVGWSIWRCADAGDALLPVTIGGLRQDWALATWLTGKPL